MQFYHKPPPLAPQRVLGSSPWLGDRERLSGPLSPRQHGPEGQDPDGEDPEGWAHTRRPVTRPQWPLTPLDEGGGGALRLSEDAALCFQTPRSSFLFIQSRPLGRDSGLWPRSGGRGLSYAEAPVPAPQKRPLLLSLRFGGGGARASSLSGCLSIRTPGAGCDFLLRCNKLPGSSGRKHLSSQGC